MVSHFLVLASISSACLVSVFVQVILFSPIDPLPLELPSSSWSNFPSNNILQVSAIKRCHVLVPGLLAIKKKVVPFSYLFFWFQRVEKLGDGVLENPEDVCVDDVGLIYTATRDGWIKRMHKNGSWENWKLVGGSNLLGLTISIDGDVLVCDAVKVLIYNHAYVEAGIFLC